jgi:purine-binding chemotaxis protein CheW
MESTRMTRGWGGRLMSGSPNVYLSCRVGREWYGINTDSIFKVLQLVALTELPNASPDVLGLLTLPDNVIPVIDLRRRFGLPDAPLRLDTPIIAVDTPDGAVGLVVDDAHDIETIDEAQIQPCTGEVSPYVVGVARCPDHLLLLLDTSLLGVEARSEVSPSS